MEKLLKTEEVAERWQVSKDYVLNQIPKGLVVIRLGKTDYRFDLEDVRNYESYLKSLNTSYQKMDSYNKVKKLRLVTSIRNESYKII
ncbi:MAG: hypothetical protein MJ232_02795 [archaeon]|nr:hypothetical protein [archaeon]